MEQNLGLDDQTTVGIFGQLKDAIFQGISLLSLVWFLRLVVGVTTSVLMYRYFGPHAMGILAIALSVVGIISFVIIEIDVVAIKRIAEASSLVRFKCVLSAYFAVEIFNKLLIAIILVGVARVVERFYHVDGLSTFLVILAIQQLVSLGYGPMGPEMLQGLFMYRDYLVQSVIAMGSQLASIGLTIFIHAGLREYLVFTVLCDALTNLYGWVLYRRVRESHAWATTRVPLQEVAYEAWDLAKAGVPVSLYYLLYKTYLNLANLLAGKWYGPTVVGYLSFVFNIINKVNSFHSSISSVLLPAFSKIKEEERKDLWDLYERGYQTMMIVAAVVTFFVALYAREATLIIGGARFLPAVLLLQLLTLQLVFRLPLQTLRMVCCAHEKNWMLFAVFALKTVCEVALYFVLTRWWQVTGLILAQVASFVVYAFCFTRVGLRFLYYDMSRARAGELWRDFAFLSAMILSIILVDASGVLTLVKKVSLSIAFLVFGALWIRREHSARRRAYLVGG